MFAVMATALEHSLHRLLSVNVNHKFAYRFTI